MEQGGWPFVGRELLVATTTERLLASDRPRGVLLRGEAGIGKSRLASIVGERLTNAGRVVVHLHGVAGLAALPFGALAPLLVALDVEPSDTLDDAVGLLAAIRRRAAERPDLVVLVDDVSSLDHGSIQAIDQLARETAVPLLITARSSVPLPAAVEALIDQDRLRPELVPPLTTTETEHLLATALGGPVDPDTVRRLHRASGGVPLYLRELVIASSEAGATRTGRLGTEIIEVVPGRRLNDLVRQRFEGLADPDREVLELLAAGQPLPVSALPVDSIDQLVEAGLVTTDREDGTMVARLAHPIYEEVVRTSTPPHRWNRRLADAADMLDPAAPDQLLRSVSMRTQGDVAVPPTELIRAARRAHQMLDHRLAVTLAGRVADTGDDGDAGDATGDETVSAAATVRGAALSALGESVLAEAALRLGVARAPDDASLARAARALGQHLALRAGRSGDAIAALDDAIVSLTDDEALALLRADQIRWMMLGGHDLGKVAPTMVEDGPARLNVVMTDALIGVMGGQLTAARRSADEGQVLGTIHGDEVHHATDLLELVRCMCSFFAGDLRSARSLARDRLDDAEATMHDAAGMWAYALSAVDLHAGRASDALRWAELAEQRLRWRDFTGLVGTASAVRATALAQLGRVTEATEALDAADDSAADIWASLQRVQAEMWLSALTSRNGRASDAVDRLRQVGEQGAASGHLYLSAFAVHVAVRLGRPETVAELLESLADRCEGDLVSAMSAHARALADHDAPMLEEVAERLMLLGLRTAAADALDQAAAEHRRARRSEHARRLELRAHHLAAGLDGARWRSPGRGRSSQLTARELDVARLAATRARSREIAAELGVSVRTVDNHLGRVFRKLKVSSRDELAGALADLGLAGQAQAGHGLAAEGQTGGPE